MVIPCPSCGHEFFSEEKDGGELCCPKCNQPLILRHSAVSVAPPSAQATADFWGDWPGPGQSIERRDAEDTSGSVHRTQAEPQPEPLPTIEFLPAHSEGVSGASELSALDVLQIPNYQVQRIIGQGAMGIVLQGRDRRSGRVVAIKMPLQGRPGSRKRLLRESHSAARLRHANICPILEVGEVGHRPFIVMEFIAGPSLRDWARQERLGPRKAAALVVKLARALEYAHQNGVIHRDVKPTNVLVDSKSGEPMLTDFGLAKETNVEESHLTHTGQVLGTPAYMAPEQAAGRTDQFGPWSDIYGLGATLYELIAGTAPFDGSLGEVLWKVQTQEPVSPRRLNRDVSVDLETICLKAMAKAPADRYPSAGEMADDLERCLTGQRIHARRRRPPRRVTLKRYALAGVLALAVAGGTLWAAQAWRLRGPTPTALPYSLVIEATGGAGRFDYHSPELEGFSGSGHSIDDCIRRAQQGMREHVDRLVEQRLPVPPPGPDPRIVIQTEKRPRGEP